MTPLLIDFWGQQQPDSVKVAAAQALATKISPSLRLHLFNAVKQTR